MNGGKDKGNTSKIDLKIVEKERKRDFKTEGNRYEMHYLPPYSFLDFLMLIVLYLMPCDTILN